MSAQQDPWVESRQPARLPKFDLMKILPAILRMLGAGAVLIAMYSFLVRGWDSGNDVFRYFLMLGHTGALTAIGLASGHWLKESKGARLLLTLSLVSIPANFAILGAFIFSQSTGIDVSTYPQYVAWAVDSLNSALMVNGVALLVLIPVTLLGFTVLARSMSKKLSILYLLSNAALLLPLRDPQLIGLMVMVLAVIVIVLSRKTSRQNASAKTNEGVIALGLQLLPLAVLVGRSLWLYSVDLFLLTVLAITVFFILRQISLYLEPGSKFRAFLEGLSIWPAVSVSFLLTEALQVMTHLPHEVLFPISALASMAMVYDISCRSKYRVETYRLLAVAGLVVGLGINLLANANPVASLLTVMISVGVSIVGYKAQQRSVFTGGIVLMLLGIAQQFYDLVKHFDLGSWAGLAILGVVSIIIASVMESQGGKLKPRFVAWKAKLAEWDR